MLSDDEYKQCCYSITCYANDLSVVHVLRALCQRNIETSHPQIGWGGTTERNWLNSEKKITLRFTSSYHRENFIKDAERILKNGLWSKISCSDEEPAQRQR
jgi:hypothetical protein